MITKWVVVFIIVKVDKINYYSKQNNKIILRNLMQRERPKSASSTYSTYIPNKPKMQTRYKERSGSRSLLGESIVINENVPQQKLEIKRNGENSHARYSESKKQRKRSNSVIIQPTSKVFDDANQPNQFRKTACLLSSQLYNTHHSQQCVCDMCTCGRHLCKFHAPALSLPKKTSYDRDYNRKKEFIPNKVFIATQYPKFQGPNLQPNSTYLKDYPSKANGDLSRPKPEDNLQFNGPAQNLSSYKADYPGHKGPNQYVKPTDNHRRDSFPLRGRTTYGSTFLGAAPKKDQFQKIHHNLKCGSGWFGDTTNNSMFHKPNPQSYAVPVKKKQKLQINPDYKRQFETSYRTDFKDKGPGVCPAKIQLQAKRKGQFKDSKIKFLENSDFKAMSPEYRSYSTSKCY